MSAEQVICASHEYVVDSASDEVQRSLHGHNWRVTAHVSAEELDASGRILPASLLEAELWTILAPLDHRHLNDLKSFSERSPIPPTAAGLARLVAEQLAVRLDDGRVRVRRVEVEPRNGLQIAWELE